MAINAITALAFSDYSTAVGGKPTFQAVNTATGAYIDIDAVKAADVILVARRDATTKAASVVIGAGTGFSETGLGAKTVSLATHATEQDRFVLFQSARHQDSNNRINVTCTGSTTVLSVGAIILP